MSELREKMARAICAVTAEPGADPIPLPCKAAPCETCLADADAALRALGEAGRTYEQGVKDGRAEVISNTHAVESVRNARLSAQLAQAREALEPFAWPPLYVFDKPMQWVPAAMPKGWIGGGWFSTEDFQRARTTLAALTAGSTEGKDADLDK